MTKEVEFVEGDYTCDNAIQVVKELKSKDKKNAKGEIIQTFGTWTKPDNFYYFRPNQKTRLTEEDLKNPSLRQLILNGRIRRTL